MAPDSKIFEQSEEEGSSTLSEAKATKRQPNSGTKRLSSGGEDDSKKRENSPLSETRPAKRQKNNEFKKYTSITRNDSTSIAANELEFEIEKARFEILNHFMNMKMQMDKDDKAMTKEMELWTEVGLANINGGKSPENEFFIKSLIDNFEEISRRVGLESRIDVDHTMDDIRKILVKLVSRIQQGFRPRRDIDAVKVTRSDTLSFLWIGLWSLVAVFSVFFHTILPKIFEYVVAFGQSTILIVFLFCILHFYDPSS